MCEITTPRLMGTLYLTASVCGVLGIGSHSPSRLLSPSLCRGPRSRPTAASLDPFARLGGLCVEAE